MESLLQQFYKDMNLSKFDYKEQKWNHTITNKTLSDY